MALTTLKSQLPLGVATPLLTAKAAGVLRRRGLGPAVAIGDQRPDLPLARGVPDPTQGHPQPVRETLTIGDAAQVALAGGADKGHGVQGAPPAHWSQLKDCPTLLVRSVESPDGVCVDV
jgi:hypothetical protein